MDHHAVPEVSERLKVRLAYQRGFQIVDGTTILAAFENPVEAFKFVRDPRRSCPAGLGQNSDRWPNWTLRFYREFLQSPVGRILKNQWGSLSGSWFWSISTSDPRFRRHGGQRGNAATKDEAVFELEREFTRFIAETEKYRR